MHDHKLIIKTYVDIDQFKVNSAAWCTVFVSTCDLF